MSTAVDRFEQSLGAAFVRFACGYAPNEAFPEAFPA